SRDPPRPKNARIPSSRPSSRPGSTLARSNPDLEGNGSSAIVQRGLTMKNAERMFRTLHATSMLASLSHANAGLAEARASLDKATSDRTAAERDELAKKEAVGAASARVRDATARGFEECRRASGALLVKDPMGTLSLEPGMRGRSTKAVLARAYFLLQHGT